MAITLEQAQGQLQAWLDASMKVSQKQSYRIGTRQYVSIVSGLSLFVFALDE